VVQVLIVVEEVAQEDHTVEEDHQVHLQHQVKTMILLNQNRQ